MSPRNWRIAVFILVPAALACAPTTPTPPVQWHGCGEFMAGHCILGPEPTVLQLGVDIDPASTLRVFLDAVEIDAVVHAERGGLRVTIDVPRSARRIELDGVEPRWRRRWVMPLDQRGPAETGAASERRTELEAPLPDSPGPQRLDALERLRRVHHRRGNPDAALEMSVRAADLAASLGHPLAETRARAAAVYYYLQRGEVSSAWSQSTRMATVPGSAETALLEAYSRGLVQWRTGDISAASRSMQRALDHATRIDDVQHEVAAASNLAAIWAESGRTRRATQQIDEARAAISDPRVSCLQRAQLSNTMGWIALLAGDVDRAHDLLEESWSAVETKGRCPNSAEAVNVAINWALTALVDEEPDIAAEWLSTIEDAPRDLQPWIDEAWTRIRLANGDDRGLPSLMKVPAGDITLDLQWNAWEHQAMLLERWGWIEGAIGAHREAEARLELALAALGSAAGAELFLAGRQASAQRLVRLLLTQGRHDEALCVARIARGRSLRRFDRVARLERASPDARAQWGQAVARVLESRATTIRRPDEAWGLSAVQRERHDAKRELERQEALAALEILVAAEGDLEHPLTCDALPPWPANAWVLLPFPLDDGWAVFRSVGDSLLARWIPTPNLDDLPSLADTLLGAEPPAPIDQVRVFPTGAAWDIPYADLRVGGRRLLELAPVVYGLDLGPINDARQASALVVADPTDDLPHARHEAHAVMEALRARRMNVRDYRGRASTRDALTSALSTATYLHYAGHGRYGGEDGWDSALLLPGDETLNVVDILAAPRVPSTAVLIGCQTGHVTLDALDGGMNLGIALLLAGAQNVLVAAGPIDDAYAARVGAELVMHGAPDDLAAALQKVELRTTARPFHDGVLRVLVR